MQAGRLRHRLTIQTRMEVSDSMGGATVTWPEKYWLTVWAAVWPIRGLEGVDAKSLEGKITHQIRMRYHTLNDGNPITTANRIYWKNKGVYYNIRSVINPDQKNISLEIMAEEEVKGEYKTS